MVEVSGSLVRTLLVMAKAADLEPAPLVAGLACETTYQGARHTSWDDYLTVLERIEVACGGPDALDELVARHHAPSMALELRAILGSFASPAALLRFVIRTVDPQMFPNVDFECARQADGCYLVSGRLNAGRPSRTWFRSSLPAMRTLTTYLGLPPARTELVDLTDRSLVFLIELPPSRTLAARAGRLARGTIRRSFGLLERFGDESRAQGRSLVQTRARLSEVGALGRELARNLDPASLADAIVDRLVRLGWEHVAIAMVPLGASELTLVRSHGTGPETHAIELAVAGRRVGRLVLGGSGDRELVGELVPWLAICVDNARTFAAMSAPRTDESTRIQRRLEQIRRDHGLSAKQLDVLLWLVRGRSNKEIASELACAESTVEYHLTRLLRETGSSGRTQLVAWFWAGASTRDA